MLSRTFISKKVLKKKVKMVIFGTSSTLSSGTNLTVNIVSGISFFFQKINQICLLFGHLKRFYNRAYDA